MYRIYIKNYRDHDLTATSENLVYSVPFTDDSYAFTDPVVTVGMGKAGSFEFSANPDHPFYNAFQHMITILRVEYDDATIFRGRVLTIDNDLTGMKKIHCEGDLAFLLDSVQPGVKDENRLKIAPLTYLQQLINNHNQQVYSNDLFYNDKYFELGEVPGAYTEATPEALRVHATDMRFGSSSWQSTSDALRELTSEFGGFFRTRYVNGHAVLDWLKDRFRDGVLSQPLQIGKNIIDLSSNAEVNSVFTALIPIGKNEGKDIYINGYMEQIHGPNNYITVPQIMQVFSDAELNEGYRSRTEYENAILKYGLIFKPVNFSNADTQEKLWNYATDYILRNFNGGVVNFSITALDLHMLRSTLDQILVGDQVDVVYPDYDSRYDVADGGTTQRVTPKIRKRLTCTEIKYALHNPENNTYTIGVPEISESHTYGESKKSKSTSGSLSGSTAKANYTGGNGGNDNTKKDQEDLKARVWSYIIPEIDLQGNPNPEYVDLYNKDPELAKAAVKTTYAVVEKAIKASNEQGNERDRVVISQLIADGASGTIKIKQNTFREQIEDKIAQGEPLSPYLSDFTEAVDSMVIDGYAKSITIKELFTLDNFIQTNPTTGKTELNTPAIANAISNQGNLFKLGLQRNPTSGKLTPILQTKSIETKADSSVVGGIQRTKDVVTSLLDFDTGSFNVITASFGEDGTGTKPTVLVDGLQGLFKVGKMVDNQFVPTVTLNKSGVIDATEDINLAGTSVKHKWIEQDDLIAGAVERTNENGDILRAAGLSITENGVLQYAVDNTKPELLSSKFQVTADAIDSEVKRAKRNEETLRSGIQQTADSISLVVDVTDPNGKRIKAAEIATAINDSDESEAHILADKVILANQQTVVQALNSNRQRIEDIEGEAIIQQGGTITALAGRFTKNGNDIIMKEGGELKVMHNGTAMRVYDDETMTAQVLVDKINGGSVKITGNHVEIDGKNTTINDVFTIYSRTSGSSTVSFVAVKTDIYTSSQIHAHDLSLAEGGAISMLVGTAPPVTYRIDGTKFPNLITDLQITGPTNNLYTLQKKTVGNSSEWTNVENATFSRATSLDPVWSGSNTSGQLLTITANPQGNTYLIGFNASDDPHVLLDAVLDEDRNITEAALSKKDLLIPINISEVQIDSGNGESTFQARYKKSIRVSGAIAYNNGWAAAYGKVSIPGSNNASGNFSVGVPKERVDDPADTLNFTVVTGTVTGPNGHANVVMGDVGSEDAVVVASVDIGNWYTDGWAAAYGKVSIPAANSANGSFGVGIPKSTFNLQPDTLNFTVVTGTVTGPNGHANVVMGDVGSEDAVVVASVDIGNWYTDGWDAAYRKVSIPGQGSNAYIDVAWPAPTTGNRTDRRYELVDDGNNSVILRCNTAPRGQQPSYVTVARHNHNKYTAGQTDGETDGATTGWNLAYGKTSVPTGTGSGSSIYVSWPDSSYNTKKERTYELANDGDNAVVLRYNSQTSGTPVYVTVARLTHNKYTAGSTYGADSVSVSVDTTTYYDSIGTVFYARATGSNGATGGQMLYLERSGDYVYASKGNWHGQTGYEDVAQIQVPSSSTPTVVPPTVDVVQDPRGLGGFIVAEAYVNGARYASKVLYMEQVGNYAYVSKENFHSQSGTDVGRITLSGMSHAPTATNLSIKGSAQSGATSLGTVYFQSMTQYVHFNVTCGGATKTYYIKVET